MGKIIGIDLGTTNSVVAVMEGGEPTVIPSAEGERLFPSVVAVNKNGERLVGRAARNQAVVNPENTIFSIKRFMGRKYDDAETQHAIGHVPYNVAKAPNGDVRVVLGEKEYSPPEISAMILSKLKADAEAFLGEPVTQAVIRRSGFPDFRDRQTSTHGESMANPTVTIETNHGTIQAELFEDLAPKTVGNFADLAKKGFYDGVIFHRVIDGFMIQGGDPTGTGRGGPGYTIPDEFGKGLAHTAPGLFSMANAGPNTGGSQFFITLAATPWLDGKHAIFGRVTGGMEVVRAIGQVATGMGDRPKEDVVMEKVTVSEG